MELSLTFLSQGPGLTYQQSRHCLQNISCIQSCLCSQVASTPSSSPLFLQEPHNGSPCFRLVFLQSIPQKAAGGILLKFKPHQALLPSKPSSGFPKANIITRPTQSGLCCHSDLTYYSLLLPHWLLGCFSNMSVIILPQDLCICYSLRHPTA